MTTDPQHASTPEVDDHPEVDDQPRYQPGDRVFVLGGYISRQIRRSARSEHSGVWMHEMGDAFGGWYFEDEFELFVSRAELDNKYGSERNNAGRRS